MSVDRDGALLHAHAHHGALVAVRVLPLRRLGLLLGRGLGRGPRIGRVRQRGVAEAHEGGRVALPVLVPRRRRVTLHGRVAGGLVRVV